MARLKMKKCVPIFPLSCNPKLGKVELTSIDIFFDHLRHAFKNPRIRNIAITGPFGVGKSSIIKSFNDQYKSPLRKGKRFLYISLGNYANLESPNAGTKPTPSSAAASTSNGSHPTTKSSFPCKQARGDEQAEPNGKNAVERRLLMQIYAAFDSKKFPYSCFHQIPNTPGIIKTISFVLFSMAILLLLLKAPLAELLVGWNPQCDMVSGILQRVLNWHTSLEAFLYGIVLLGAAILFARGFRFFIPQIKTSSFALKLTNAEWNLEKDACEDYLDRYTQELIYCLKRIHREIDNTVVFEDMDRLSADVCISIFTRLREINHILNTHMGGSKYVRFVFVINDKIANRLECNKFFDYILPVIPTLNQVSAEFIFKKNLTETNKHLETACRKEWQLQEVGYVGYLLIKLLDRHAKPNRFFCSGKRKLCTDTKPNGQVCTIGKWIDRCVSLSQKGSKYVSYSCFQDMVTDRKNSTLLAAAPYLTDYRRQYAILNEYALVVRLYHRNNPQELTCDILDGVLAFLIYKHFWPEDYDRCITYDENVLTGRTVTEAAGGIHQEFLQILLDSNKLNIRCFHYAGFSQDTVNKLWEAKLRAGTKEMQCKQIQEIQADDLAYIIILKDFCQVSPGQPDSCPEEVLAEAIKCVVRCNPVEAQQENDWFFKDRDITVCLRVLASIDLASCINFILLCKGSDQNFDVFAKCLRRKAIHTLNGEWTLEMARILVTGLCRNRLDADILYLADGTLVDLQTLDDLSAVFPIGVGG